MNEYTKIGTFYYKTKLYKALFDQNNKFFFLKINNNQYEYVTLKEYIELLNIFGDNDNIRYINIYNKKQRKIKLIPKLLINSKAIIISLSLLTLINNTKPAQFNTDYVNSGSYSSELQTENETEIAIQKYLDNIAKDTNNFNEESYSNILSYVNIYDSNGLDTYFNNTKKDITYSMIREVIQNNEEIPYHLKPIFIEMANNLEKKYPDLDLRIWYKNLQTLKVIECEDEFDLKIQALSTNAEACYKRAENTIYTLKGYKYEPKTWEYQILTHEIGHTIRISTFKENDKTIRINFTNSSGNIVIVEEALNSLFTLRAYDENEMNIAYQLQSNMIELMVDSMDNYDYQDYIEHNITYFEQKLNEFNQNDKAIEMLHLMNLQYKDYHNNNIDVSEDQYYPLYDYIATMYYTANIKQDMNQSQLEEIKNNFIYKLTYDVPAKYTINTNHINEHFNTYCNEKGLSYVTTK